MAVPTDRKYTRTHEWVLVDGDTATVGLTDFAQNELGDITYVELPAVGDTLDRSDSFGIVESVKAASDIYMPVGGEVTESNAEAESAPELINSSPYEDAWLIRIKLTDPRDLDELMDAAAYEQYLQDQGAH